MQSLWGLLAKAVGQSLKRVTDLAPSRASPLPHLGCISRLESSCAVRSNAAVPRIPSPNSDQNCGSGLARESGASVAEEGGWSTAFAGKPAPTFGVYFKVGTGCVPPAQMPVPHPESQARTAIKTVGAGLLAKAVRQWLQGVTDLAPSRASPLPHLKCISRLESSCASRSDAGAAPRIPSPNSDQNCGSGLARESGGSVAAGGD
jgi:hypothetical protein